MRTARLSVLMLLFLPSFAAWGQYGTSWVPYPDNVKKTIVRECHYPSTVAYVETSTARYFVYDDGSPQTINVQIDNDYDINDLEVLGEYAYFCGSVVSTGMGLFGWFSVTDLFVNNMPYYLYSNFPTYTGMVDNFSRLVVYDSPSSPRIAVAGSTTTGRGCTMELGGVAGNIGGWSYTIGESPDTRETIFDVCVTDRYVVTAGCFNNFGQAACLRIHDRNNMFVSGGCQDVMHPYLHYGNPACAWGTTDDLCLTTMDNDLVGVARLAGYTPDMTQPNNYQYGAMVNVFDVQAAVSGTSINSVYSMFLFQQNIYGQNPTLTNVVGVEGLVYSTTYSRFAMLTYVNTSNYGPASAITEFTVPPTSPVATHLLDFTHQMSIGSYNGTNGYVTLGCQPSNLTKAFYHSGTFGGTYCSENENYDIHSDFLYAEKPELEAFQTVTGGFRCIKIQPKRYELLEKTTDCEYQQRTRQ